MSGPRDKADGRGLQPATRIGLWSLVLWGGAAAGAAWAGPEAVGGVATGGAVTLCSYAIHLGLARSWAFGRRRRSARAYLWFLWLLKWPLVGSLLYVSLRTGFAAPGWICAGAGIVPVAATLFALRVLLRGTSFGPARGEAI
jgi:hypothetical protein